MNVLIFGVSGQDGAYLARDLTEKGHKVFGTSRDALGANFANLERLGVRNAVTLLSADICDFRSTLLAIEKSNPDEVYNLAGQTSVGLSYEQPVEAIESIALATLNILEVIRFSGRAIRFYSACSSECFGSVGSNPANEDTPMQPLSPYAVAKTTAFNLVKSYRKAYGLHACSGLLFNHESPLRPERFVTQKIIRAASRIIRGSTEQLALGDLSVVRDWGWAPDYVAAMPLMLEREQPQDYVIATGKAISLQTFVASAFAYFDLDWQDHTVIKAELMRPSDIPVSCGDASRAMEQLGWRPSKDVYGVIGAMCEAAKDCD